VGIRPTPEEQLETLYEVLDAGLIQSWAVAVDGGANIGDWSAVMSRRFSRVIAFEPNEAVIGKLRANLAGFGNVDIRQKALFREPCRGVMLNPPKRQTSTSAFLRPNGAGDVEAVTIDSLDLPSCGLIKLDLEGGEFDAVLGARETIKAHRPVVICEVNRHAKQYGRSPGQVTDLLTKLGYEIAMHRGEDIVFKWGRA